MPSHVVPVQAQINDPLLGRGESHPLAFNVPTLLIDPMLRCTQFLHLFRNLLLLAQKRIFVVRVFKHIGDASWRSALLFLRNGGASRVSVKAVLAICDFRLAPCSSRRLTSAMLPL